MSDAIAKRTYNLSTTTIEEVRRISAKLHVSQDSVVARAIHEYVRMERDLTHAAAWAKAAHDPAFHADMVQVASDFATADVASWDE